MLIELYVVKIIMCNEDELLMLSGIQHIAFCERQWALIHIEKLWEENILSIEGKFLHDRADNPFIAEKRKGIITARSVNIVSYKLGLYGIADVIEYVQSDISDNAVKIPRRKGFWRPQIVEYKRGKPKHIDCDKIQLTAQAMCMEEMNKIIISEGFIFYDQIKHREHVLFDETLRSAAIKYAQRMHALYEEGITPKAVENKMCNKNCSLHELCLPKISNISVSKYMESNLA